MTTNNLNPIASKYWCALTAIQTAPQDDRAILLALQLAVDEAAHTPPPTPPTATQRHTAWLNDQLQQLNDWLVEHATDLFFDPTTDAILAALERQRGQIVRLHNVTDLRIAELEAEAANLHHNLQTANDERNYSEGQLATLTAWLRDHGLANDDRNEVDIAIAELSAQHTEIAALRAQLAQIDTGSATPVQALATVPSSPTPPPPNSSNVVGEPAPTEVQISAQIASDDRDLSQAAVDYQEGLNAQRWSWRQIPRHIRIELLRHTISRLPSPTQEEFNAQRPAWMPSATSHVHTFGIPWSQLTNPTHEIEVPA